MYLYNTLTRTKEEFKPIDDKTAKVYSCGPTVYFYATIGNFRAYIASDILKKVIRLAGFDVFDVLNITDVGHLVSDGDEGEDKVEMAARKAGKTAREITEYYTNQFFVDYDKLNLARPKIIATVSEYIDGMIKFIQVLEKKGFTYQTSDGIYFDSSLFPDYTKLSRQKIEDNIEGARIEKGEKRNPHDFALWKHVSPNALQKWKSPWGEHGCPGWHIECSAVALETLGADTFDIHTGGIDAIPIHHTNEIAQTESHTGKQMCNFWVHNEFLMVDGGKMSKSLGNAYTLSELNERGFSHMDFRYFVLLGSYRSILNFTFDGLKSAQTAYKHLVSLLAKHKTSDETAPTECIWNDFKREITDDLNTPKAIAVIWNAVKQPASKSIYDIIIKMDNTLSLGLEKAVEEYLAPKSVPHEITQLAEQRLVAKQNKDWATADALRKKIHDLGFEIVDTKDGYTIK